MSRSRTAVPETLRDVDGRMAEAPRRELMVGIDRTDVVFGELRMLTGWLAIPLVCYGIWFILGIAIAHRGPATLIRSRWTHCAVCRADAAQFVRVH
jgi:hypothetical protein